MIYPDPLSTAWTTSGDKQIPGLGDAREVKADGDKPTRGPNIECLSDTIDWADVAPVANWPCYNKVSGDTIPH